MVGRPYLLCAHIQLAFSPGNVFQAVITKYVRNKEHEWFVTHTVGLMDGFLSATHHFKGDNFSVDWSLKAKYGARLPIWTAVCSVSAFPQVCSPNSSNWYQTLLADSPWVNPNLNDLVWNNDMPHSGTAKYGTRQLLYYVLAEGHRRELFFIMQWHTMETTCSGQAQPAQICQYWRGLHWNGLACHHRHEALQVYQASKSSVLIDSEMILLDTIIPHQESWFPTTRVFADQIMLIKLWVFSRGPSRSINTCRIFNKAIKTPAIH